MLILLNALLIGLGAITFIQLIYYVFIFGKFSFTKLQTANPKNIPVSVIVCAKNEAENIQKYIPLLLSQNYPAYELVLIDDASSDETRDLFEAIEKQHNFVKLVKVDNNEAFWGNKKYALTLGIKAAKNEYLLFTDADCYPQSQNWIAEMTAHFTSTKTIVLGYGAYEKVKNSFLNKIIRFETLLTATQYFAWAKLGKPYMGVGRNMAYTKEVFKSTNGFKSHYSLMSGDDDLFIQEAAKKRNYTIQLDPDTFQYSAAKEDWESFVLQKSRHYTTSPRYKVFKKAMTAFISGAVTCNCCPIPFGFKRKSKFVLLSAALVKFP